MNHRNPAIKRILADVKELQKHPSNRYHAAPAEDNMFEWHFTIRGPPDTPFEGGIYHGRIILPAEYPFKPPNIVFLTPNGRFEVGTKICLSISAYHEETWQPAWGVRTMLEAIISFFPSEGNGAIGALDWKPEERKKLAQASHNFHCTLCGKVKNLLSTTIENDQPDSEIQAQIAEIRMSLPSQSGKVLKQNPVVAGLSQEDDAINQQLLQGDCLGVTQLSNNPDMAQACAIASMEENADVEDTLDGMLETEIAVAGATGTPRTPNIASAPIASSSSSASTLPVITPLKDQQEEEEDGQEDAPLNSTVAQTRKCTACCVSSGQHCVEHDKDMMLAPTSPLRNPKITPIHPSTPAHEPHQRILSTTSSPMTTTNNIPTTPSTTATAHTNNNIPNTSNTSTVNVSEGAREQPSIPAPQAHPQQQPQPVPLPVPAAGAGRGGGLGGAVNRREERGLQLVDAVMILLVGRIVYILYGILQRNHLFHSTS